MNGNENKNSQSIQMLICHHSEKMDIEDNCSPMENCDDKSTFELTENSYFHFHSSDKNTKEFSSGEVTDNRTSNSLFPGH
jgi:hypothetical protein